MGTIVECSEITSGRMNTLIVFLNNLFFTHVKESEFSVNRAMWLFYRKVFFFLLSFFFLPRLSSFCLSFLFALFFPSCFLSCFLCFCLCYFLCFCLCFFLCFFLSSSSCSSSSGFFASVGFSSCLIAPSRAAFPTQTRNIAGGNMGCSEPPRRRQQPPPYHLSVA